MQFLLDNAIAALIGGVVVLLMAHMALRNAESSVRAQNYYAARMQGKDVIEVVKDDFINIASVQSLSLNAEGQLQALVLQADVDSTQEGEETLAYRLAAADSCVAMTTSGLSPVACYQLERRVGGAGSYTTITAPRVTTFRIALRDSVSQSIGADQPHRARQLDVELALLPPGSGTTRGVDWETRWRSTFRPGALNPPN